MLMAYRTYAALDSRFTRLGRFQPAEKALELWWSGSGIRFSCAASSLEVDIESHSHQQKPWMAVFADDAPVARFPLLPGLHRYPILTGMDPDFPHEISLLRDTQPTFDEEGPVILQTLITDGKLQPSATRAQLIEFVGDSLTVGEGTVGPHAASEWRMAWMSQAYAYPAMVADALHADRRTIALSGWGVWRSWDNDAAHRIGNIYDRLCAPTPGGDIPCPDTLPQAAAVVINLGTNDSNAILSAENQQDASYEITDCAVELMNQIRHRNPDASIVWAYGLCGHALEAPLERAVDRLRIAGDLRVSYLSLSDCNGNLGSRQHPSHEAHRIAAEEISAHLRSVLQTTERGNA